MVYKMCCSGTSILIQGNPCPCLIKSAQAHISSGLCPLLLSHLVCRTGKSFLQYAPCIARTWLLESVHCLPKSFILHAFTTQVPPFAVPALLYLSFSMHGQRPTVQVFAQGHNRFHYQYAIDEIGRHLSLGVLAKLNKETLFHGPEYCLVLRHLAQSPGHFLKPMNEVGQNHQENHVPVGKRKRKRHVAKVVC